MLDTELNIAMRGREDSEWSSPSLFRVAAGPSEEEFQEALAVVRAYLEDSPVGGEALGTSPDTVQPSTKAAPGPDTASSSTGIPLTELLATPNETGIRSEVAATTGVTFGVHGVSNSTVIEDPTNLNEFVCAVDEFRGHDLPAS